MMEGAIGFGASTIPILLPGFVAAGVGYLVFVGFGSWGGLDAQAISVPGPAGVHRCAPLRHGRRDRRRRR